MNVVKKVFFLLVALAGFLFCFYLGGYRINYTGSLPVGIWKLQLCRNPERGMYVVVSMKWDVLGIRRQYHRPELKLLKVVGGLPGDVVTCIEKQVYVNNAVLDNVVLQEKDSFGRLMPKFQYPYVVPKDCYFLCAPVLKSWDSRYFGAVSRREILYRAEPVLTFPAIKEKKQNEKQRKLSLILNV